MNNFIAVIRGFVARRRFQKLCLAAEDQARRVTAFLGSIPSAATGLDIAMTNMNKEDDARPKG